MQVENHRVLMALLLTGVLVGPAAAARPLPFAGAVGGTELHTPSAIVPGFRVDGAGRARVGRSRHGQFQVTWGGDVRADILVSDNLHREFVAANGDRLVFNGVAQGTPPDENGLIRVEEKLAVSGGTGRFAGAVGHITVKRLVRIDPNDPTAENASFGFFFGMISLSR